jgi:hypothetical protein
MATDYPTTAIDEIKLIVQIVRAGQIVGRRDEFAKAGWHVQGFIQGIVLGEPMMLAQTVIAELPTKVTTDIEALDVLEMLAGETDAKQRALSIPREIWRGLLKWLRDRLDQALADAFGDAT